MQLKHFNHFVFHCLCQFLMVLCIHMHRIRITWFCILRFYHKPKTMLFCNSFIILGKLPGTLYCCSSSHIDSIWIFLNLFAYFNRRNNKNKDFFFLLFCRYSLIITARVSTPTAISWALRTYRIIPNYSPASIPSSII